MSNISLDSFWHFHKACRLALFGAVVVGCLHRLSPNATRCLTVLSDSSMQWFCFNVFPEKQRAFCPSEFHFKNNKWNKTTESPNTKSGNIIKSYFYKKIFSNMQQCVSPFYSLLQIHPCFPQQLGLLHGPNRGKFSIRKQLIHMLILMWMNTYIYIYITSALKNHISRRSI